MTTTTVTRDLAVWRPPTFEIATEPNTNRLLGSVLRAAMAELEAEREGGSNLPEYGSLPYQALVGERGIVLAESLGSASEVVELRIMDWIERRELYRWHPEERWEDLGQMVMSMSEGMSSGGRSVWTRVAGQVLPYLRAHGIATADNIQEIIMSGKGNKSKLYHGLAALQGAIAAGGVGRVRDIMADIQDDRITREAFLEKLRGKDIIPPALATLFRDGDGRYTLTVVMSEEQMGLIMRRLGGRVKL